MLRTLKKIISIQECLSGKYQNLCDPNRRFVREGQLNWIVNDRTSKELHYFQFNDLLMFVLADKSLLNTKVKWKVESKAIVASIDISDIPDTQKEKFRFSVKMNDKLFLFSFPTQKGKEEWIKEFYWHRMKSQSVEISNTPSISKNSKVKSEKSSKK